MPTGGTRIAQQGWFSAANTGVSIRSFARERCRASRSFYGRRARRFRCRAIQRPTEKGYAELKQMTALTVRHTVADRSYARGADESQVDCWHRRSQRGAGAIRRSPSLTP